MKKPSTESSSFDTAIENWERYGREVRAEMMRMNPAYAEAVGEEMEAEAEYEEVKHCKKSNPPVFYAARDKRTAARLRVSEIERHAEFRTTAELTVWRREEAAKPKLHENPAMFAAWVVDHASRYYTAKRNPERVFMVPMWMASVKSEYEGRYTLFAYLLRTLTSDGIEAAIKVYVEEVEDRLTESLWATVETTKVEGDPARRNEKSDGGRYESSQLAALTPIISDRPCPLSSLSSPPRSVLKTAIR